METKEVKDPQKGNECKSIGQSVADEQSLESAVKKRLPKKVRHIPDYYFLPRKSIPSNIAFYGSWILGGIGAGMLAEIWINKKMKGLKPITLGCLGMLICHKLITAILQIIEAQATKPVILGNPMHSGSAVSCANTNADAGKRQENNAFAFQARTPKKITMGNDNAEEVFTRKGRKSKRIVNEK